MGNIISNALAYIDQPKGFVHIIIDDVPSLLPPSGYADLSLTKNVSIQIQDSGIGMDREYLEYHYFRPMKKENALKPGSGLSVHIAQRLVHTLGGNIAVSSQSGMVSLGQVVGQQKGRTLLTICAPR
jgi:signal transduction histidine kinase